MKKYQMRDTTEEWPVGKPEIRPFSTPTLSPKTQFGLAAFAELERLANRPLVPLTRIERARIHRHYPEGNIRIVQRRGSAGNYNWCVDGRRDDRWIFLGFAAELLAERGREESC